MSGTFKITIILIGIIILSLSEIALMFWLGRNDVKNFCDEIKPGRPVEQLANLADKYDVRYIKLGPREVSGVWTLVNTPRSFGLHTCMVRHDNTAVLGSQYGYAD